MGEMILRTKALKICNKGGGVKWRTVVETVKDMFGVEHRQHHHERTEGRIKGSDYVVFLCPWPSCKARNKQSMYQAKNITPDGVLSFKCWSCRREIEVEKPVERPQIIVPELAQQPRHVGLLGPDGRPIG